MRHKDRRNSIIKGVGVLVCAASVTLAVFLFTITKGYDFDLALFGYFLVPVLTFIVGFIIFREGLWRPIIFEYRGYSSIVDYSREDKIYFGMLLETQEMITFQADDFKKVERYFQETVDIYICSHEAREEIKATYHHGKAIG